MNRGIVLLGIGDTAYGKFAANMAISIKQYNKDLPIQLIYEKKTIEHLTDWHKSFIDVFTEIDPIDCYEKNKLIPALAKLSVYKYAHFDENIYLDVDGLCLKSLDGLFEICKEGYYFSQVVGRYLVEKEPKEFPEMQWCKPEVFIKHFDLKVGDIVPALNTSFQYFKKCEESEILFNTALKCLTNGISNKDRWFKWGKDNLQPDELYMNIALSKVGIYPILSPSEKVIYFDDKRIKNIAEIEEKFYILGLYGGIRFTHTSLQEYYDRVMEKICRSTYKRDHVYKCHNLMRRKIS